jgi:hypothetical protein
MTTKINFNIVCNSTLNSSFTGNIYNANYYVNLASVLNNDEDYKKKYKISFRIKTASSANISNQEFIIKKIYRQIIHWQFYQNHLTIQQIIIIA